MIVRLMWLIAFTDEWLNLIEECLAHEVQAIREKAIHALPLVFDQYLREDNLMYGELNANQKRMQLMDKYCEQLTNTGVNGLVLRMGYARAVGEFTLLHFRLSSIVSAT